MAGLGPGLPQPGGGSLPHDHGAPGLVPRTGWLLRCTLSVPSLAAPPASGQGDGRTE